MPENLPGDPAATVPVPLRYQRRDRRVFYLGNPERYYTVDETVLQWRGPDGEWRDVPTVEEGKNR